MKNQLVQKIINGAKITAAATLIPLVIGCQTLRPYAEGEKNYPLVKNFSLEQISEKNSKYQAKGLEIFGEKYYIAKTDLGDAMFKWEKSIKENSYEVNKKGKIQGTTSIKSGEGGLFVIEPVKTTKGYADWVEIESSTKKAIIIPPKIIKKKGDLGIFYTTEKNTQFNFALAETPTNGICHVIQVEDKEMNKEGFYNLYFIPVDKSDIRINKKGKITIINEDKILRPKFYCWDQLKDAISKLPEEAKRGFQNLGMPKAYQNGNN